MEIVRAAERGLARPQPDGEQGKDARGTRPQTRTRHLDGLDWEVIVVKDKLVNAKCLPGGKIIVYTGLLDQMKMDAEIATVLGHEVRTA
jgi:predicted Zn-dependent protease